MASADDKGHKGFTRYTKHEANDPLTTQRSLIKEYEPRRKIYGVFGIIDSLVYQYLTLNNPELYDWWILKTKKIFAIINNSLILV